MKNVHNITEHNSSLLTGNIKEICAIKVYSSSKNRMKHCGNNANGLFCTMTGTTTSVLHVRDITVEFFTTGVSVTLSDRSLHKEEQI